MRFDTAIKGGRLITPTGIEDTDLGIAEGKIAAIGPELEADEVLEAAGCWVIPGGVDPHVHLQMPTSATVSSDDWGSGTLAAACGGTTTVVDFVEPEPDQPLVDAFHARQRQAEGVACVDYGLHMTITSASPSVLGQIPAVIDAGLPSFKLYTTYAGFRLSAGEIRAVLDNLAPLPALPIVHAESDAIVARNTARQLAVAPDQPSSHPLSRPPEAEAEAIKDVIELARNAGSPVYFVHVSTADGARAIAQARLAGQAVFGETCPQYLLLDETMYNRESFEGAKFVCSPPLRPPDHSPVLWQALAEGNLQVVATDHCPFFFHGQKDLGQANFTEIPGGLPSVELRLRLVFSYGVAAGRLSAQQWVERCSSGPAKLFGLYPQKGALALGSDADVVVFDPQGKTTVAHAQLHENVDYTPYEGLEVRGQIRAVVLRGQILARGGEYVGAAGTGGFVRRSLVERDHG